MSDVKPPDANRGLAQTRVYRNRGNYVLSLLGFFGLLILMIAVDALHLYSVFNPPEEDDSFLDGLPFYGLMFITALVLLIAGIRPSVEWDGKILRLQNMFRTVTVPASSIVDVDNSGKHLRIITKEGSFTAWAMERWNYEVAQDQPGVGGALVEQLLRKNRPRSNGHDKPSRVQVVWRWPSRIDLALCSLWLGYALAAAWSTYSGISPAPFS